MPGTIIIIIAMVVLGTCGAIVISERGFKRQLYPGEKTYRQYFPSGLVPTEEQAIQAAKKFAEAREKEPMVVQSVHYGHTEGSDLLYMVMLVPEATRDTISRGSTSISIVVDPSNKRMHPITYG